MEKKLKIVITSGGFDPLHSGHIEYLKAAKALGDKLIVGVNSDEWLTRKKGQAFMPWEERYAILTEMDCVDKVIQFDDSDDTAIELIRFVQAEHKEVEIIFANGGDRTKENIPEMVFNNVEFVFGVGGIDKKNSSSWILERWNKQRKNTRWGYWEVLDDEFKCTKVKKLVVNPGGCLSYQKHTLRGEHWFVASGYGKVITNNEHDISHYNDSVVSLTVGESVNIPRGTWHQLINDSKDEPLVIVEIQYGEECDETDITSE